MNKNLSKKSNSVAHTILVFELELISYELLAELKPQLWVFGKRKKRREGVKGGLGFILISVCFCFYCKVLRAAQRMTSTY